MTGNKINILYTSPFGDFKGGGQWSLFTLITHLDRNLVNPIVALPETGTFSEALEESGIKSVIFPFTRISRLSIKKIVKIVRFIKENQVDLIHTDDITETFYFGIAGKLTKTPVVWHIRVSERNKWLDRIVSRFTTAIITVSKELAEKLTWINTDKITPIYNAIHITETENKSVSPLEKFKKENKVLIANIGRINHQKGQQEFVKQLSLLNDDGKVAFIGDKSSEDFKKINYYLNENDLADKVIFTGHINNMESAYRDIDILIVTSIYGEGFPRTIIEAMVNKIPVVSTSCIGASELIEDGKNGFIIHNNDFTKFVEKLNILTASKEMRQKMGNEGYKKALGLFSVEKQVDAVWRLYSKLLQINKL